LCTVVKLLDGSDPRRWPWARGKRKREDGGRSRLVLPQSGATRRDRRSGGSALMRVIKIKSPDGFPLALLISVRFFRLLDVIGFLVRFLF